MAENLNYGISNYSGKLPDISANIKNFVVGLEQSNLVSIKTYNDEKVITFNSSLPVVISGGLTVLDNISTPSDVRLKKNIEPISSDIVEQLMNLEVKEFELKSDQNNNKHYGFIAQDVEKYLPDLVCEKSIKNNKEQYEPAYKTINYLEIIPLLVYKIQDLQKQIDNLKGTK
jgi:hypothetical protein